MWLEKVPRCFGSLEPSNLDTLRLHSTGAWTKSIFEFRLSPRTVSTDVTCALHRTDRWNLTVKLYVVGTCSQYRACTVLSVKRFGHACFKGCFRANLECDAQLLCITQTMPDIIIRTSVLQEIAIQTSNPSHNVDEWKVYQSHKRRGQG